MTTYDEVNAKAIAIMAKRPELKQMSLDEWLHEHWDKLSQTERNECTAVIDLYFEAE